MSQRVLFRSNDGSVMEQGESEDIERLLEEGAIVWLDVSVRDQESVEELGERFGFDAASLEDVLDVEQLPKHEVYEDHLFVVLHALTFDADERLDTHEIDCFVSDRLLVTMRAAPIVGVDWLWDAVQSHSHLADGHAGELFAHLTEVLGRRFLDTLDEFERLIDDLGERALNADQRVLAEIQVLRREETTIRRVLRPQRMVVRAIRSNPDNRLGEEAINTLGDAYDVHNLVVESLLSTRALLTDTLDTYRGASAEREAAATTLLTVYAAILLPLSLITSWYGMNVTNLPGSTRSWGWWMVTIVMVVVGIGSWAVFVRAGIVRLPRSRFRHRVPRATGLASGLGAAAKVPFRPFIMLWRPQPRHRPSGRPSRLRHNRDR